MRSLFGTGGYEHFVFLTFIISLHPTMQGPGHPLQGVGYNDRPSRFDQLSRAASSLDFLPSHIPTASTSQIHAPASSNGDQGPSPPDHPARPTKKSRKSSSGPAGTGNGEEEGPLKKKAKQTLSCSECKVCRDLLRTRWAQLTFSRWAYRGGRSR